MSLPRTRRFATLRRAVGLLRSFPLEQADPARFYRGLAADTADLLDALSQDAGLGGLAGKLVLDVGGGPGYFTAEFARRQARYISVEPDAAAQATLRAHGETLPLRDASFDIAYSSNVAEHVPNPWALADELLRVTRPGGLAVLSYTVWLGPFGGHETGLWQHYVGGAFARDRYTARHGHPPKNVFGTSLFDVSAAAGIRWAHSTDAEIVGLFPRYHPAWAWWVTRVPVLREFAVSNLVVVLRA